MQTSHSTPQSGDSCLIFIKRDRETCQSGEGIKQRPACKWQTLTVNLLLILHDEEGVIVDVAEELDVGPDTTSMRSTQRGQGWALTRPWDDHQLRTRGSMIDEAHLQ